MTHNQTLIAITIIGVILIFFRKQLASPVAVFQSKVLKVHHNGRDMKSSEQLVIIIGLAFIIASVLNFLNRMH
jgi:hypothetical protein